MSGDVDMCSTLDNTASGKIKENCSSNYKKAGCPEINDLKEENITSKQLSNETCTNQDECEDFETDIMTGSYGEISLEQDLSSKKTEAFCDRKITPSRRKSEESKVHLLEKSPKDRKRPSSLILTKSSKNDFDKKTAVENIDSWKQIHKSQQTSNSQTTSVDGSPSLSSEEFAIWSPAHRRNGSDTSGLSDLPGTVTVDGDMVSFFAEDLQEKIKLSSPVSRWADSPTFSGSRSSTPSLHRQVLQSQVPVIDANAISDLEADAKKVATCIDTMLENLSGTLQSISSLTVDYMETYETAVCKTCDSVDTSIKTMYHLVAKCEELSKSVAPLYKIAQDIKTIKKVLDQFESTVEKKS